MPIQPGPLPYATASTSRSKLALRLSNASWTVCAIAAVLTAFFPTDVVEALSIRIGCSILAFALGAGCGAVALAVSRGSTRSAWLSCGANLLGLLLAALYYVMLFRQYRAQGWL
jgi:hypothetical protein